MNIDQLIKKYGTRGISLLILDLANKAKHGELRPEWGVNISYYQELAHDLETALDSYAFGEA